MKSNTTPGSTRNIPACGALPRGSGVGAEPLIGDSPCDVLGCGGLCRSPWPRGCRAG